MAVTARRYDTTLDATRAVQNDPDVADADILVIPNEGVLGVVREGWPVAVTITCGDLIPYAPDLAPFADERYARSIAYVRALASQDPEIYGWLAVDVRYAGLVELGGTVHVEPGEIVVWSE